MQVETGSRVRPQRNSSLLSVFTRFLVLLSFYTFKELVILVDGQVALSVLIQCRAQAPAQPFFILYAQENDSATNVLIRISSLYQPFPLSHYSQALYRYLDSYQRIKDLRLPCLDSCIV